jgi:DegV family protein with EDD domain
MSKPKVHIVTDSTCDLSHAEIDTLGVTVVPLSVSFGPEVFYDGQLSKDEYWEKAQGPFWPRTSQPSLGAFERAFARQVGAGFDVLCLTLLTRYSGTYGTACAAAHQFGDRVTVLDSGTVSAGLGWQVIAAAEEAARGAGLDDLAELTTDMASRTRLYATLDTIENVRKGGRLANLMPLIDRLLRVFDLKFVIVMANGQIGLAGAARSYGRALERVREGALDSAPLERVAVLHTRAQERAKAFAETLAEQTGLSRELILVVEGGPVLACHAGPNVMGAFVLSKSPPA